MLPAFANRLAFIDHSNASFFGMGPWQVSETPTFQRWTFLPCEGGFAYSPMVLAWSDDVAELFTI